MKKFLTWFSLSILFVFSMYTAVELSGMAATYEGIARRIVEATPKTGALNAVTAIVFDFRGYDTLGESFVLFTAITALTTVLRKPVITTLKKRGGNANE